MPLARRKQTDALVPVPRRLLVGPQELSGLLGISMTVLHKLRKQGRFLSHITFNDRPRWRLDEVRAWVTCGCPDPKGWTWAPGEATVLQIELDQRRQELAEVEKKLTLYREQIPALEAEHRELVEKTERRRRLAHAMAGT